MSGQIDDTPGQWELEWEPIRRAGAPERYPPRLEASYAEFPLRALAFAIDILLLWLVFQLLGQARTLVVLWYTRDQPQANDEALALSAGVMILLITLASLLVVYFWRVFRASPGQLALGLFVLERGRGRLPRRRSLVIRWLLLYAPFIFLLSYTQLIDLLFRTQLLTEADPLILASAAFVLPLAWYAVLALSVLLEKRRGRGLHDRLSSTVVARRAGAPS